MNLKRSKLVQMVIVSLIVIGLLITALPGIAQNEKSPLRPEMKQFFKDRVRQPDLLMRRYADKVASDFPNNVPSLPPHTALPGPSKPMDAWAPNSAYAFADCSAGDFEIYTTPSYAGPLNRTTYNPAYDSMPKLNRGSNRIVFISDRDGNNEVYVMNADGSGQTRLTWTPANEYFPAWSPDGSKIAFYSYRDQVNNNSNAEIYVMNANGSNQTRLTFNTAWDGHPGWSPDGTRLVFASARAGDQEIWVMNSDGSNPHSLTPQIGYAAFPDWSPDGNRIAFTADVNGDNWFNIALINADGTDLRHIRMDLPSLNIDYMAPAWSPDGRSLAVGVVFWILYQGEYYWLEAGIENWDINGMSAQSVACNTDNWGYHTCWYPDWETTDGTAPSSQMNALPRWVNTEQFTVSWHGEDVGPAGLASYDIQYRDDDVHFTWMDWAMGTTLNSFTFSGTCCHTYYFRSRARDYAGNIEAYPSSPDAMTTIYRYALHGQSFDNRERPLVVVSIQPNPSALNNSFSNHDGTYDLYFASGGVYTLTTTRNNFGVLPPLLNVTVPSSNSLPALYLPPLDNQISDSHFESGDLSAWNPSGASGELTPTITSPAHAGLGAVMLGGMVPTDTLTTGPWHSTIEQTINVPPTIVSGTLSLLYRVDSAEPLSDTLTAYVIGANNTLTFTLPLTTSEWTHAWFDLSAWNEPTATVKIDFAIVDTGREATIVLDEVTWGSAIEGSYTVFLPIARR